MKQWDWRLFLTGIGLALSIFFLTPVQAASPLPPLQAHTLPPSLRIWQDRTQEGDYFAEVQPTSVGYLVWSEFPVKVYIEMPPSEDVEESASYQRFQQWVKAVSQAVAEWSEYLPLKVVTETENADILVKRSRPPWKVTVDPETGQLQIPRAQTAQARYQFYLRSVPDAPPILSHRFTIDISPNQGEALTLATARHEIGHALGIWGHSPEPSDALYFSQVSNPPSISPRDINTLKKVYLQPTRLGWALSED